MSDSSPKKIDLGRCEEDADSKDNGLIEVEEAPMQLNIFLDHKVLKEFMNLGSQDDLELLRQISQDYYEAFQETFFDCVEIDLIIGVIASTGGGSHCCDSEEDTEVKNEKAKENVRKEKGKQGKLKIGESLNLEYKAEVDEILSDEEYEKLIKIPAVIDKKFNVSFTLETGDQGICECGCTPITTHLFRKLDFEQTWIGKLKYDKPSLYEIALQVSPYITSLRLNNLPFSFKNPGLKYAEFLNKFTNLKNLEIHQVDQRGNYYFRNVKGMSLDQLKIGFDNLKLKPKIKIHADTSSFWENGHLNILTKFGLKENMSFDFYYLFPYESDFEEFQQIFTRFGHLKTIKYYIKLISRGSRDLDEVKIFTRICTQLDKQIGKLVLILDWDRPNDIFDQEHQLGFKNCLAQLTPYVTKMKVIQQVNKPFDILNIDAEWPKLLGLKINGYEDALEILKKCSCLEKLGLHVDQRLCFFSNKEKTEKENLKHFFGNMGQLRELKFLPLVKAGDKISNGSELEEYLMEILPHLKSITYDEDYESYQS